MLPLYALLIGQLVKNHKNGLINFYFSLGHQKLHVIKLWYEVKHSQMLNFKLVNWLISDNRHVNNITKFLVFTKTSAIKFYVKFMKGKLFPANSLIGHL